jgi:hemolysin activation/secretion protein
MSWVARGLAQMSDGNLIPSEQLGLGGYATARGYEERESNTDQGWFLSNELRSPPFSVGSLLKKKDRMQLLAFWDYGVGENKDLGQDEDPHILFHSVGCGLRYTVNRYFSLRFDYGWQLADSGQDRTPSTGPGDDGRRRQRSRAHIGAVASF